mmetsp:Transcript_58402/g.96866  ORF Transcript_58402/g.96866 Transcript_58402/m.96866 type:complete len:212 (+) Transcript_58402:206-841(+)
MPPPLVRPLPPCTPRAHHPSTACPVIRWSPRPFASLSVTLWQPPPLATPQSRSPTCPPRAPASRSTPRKHARMTCRRRRPWRPLHCPTHSSGIPAPPSGPCSAGPLPSEPRRWGPGPSSRGGGKTGPSRSCRRGSWRRGAPRTAPSTNSGPTCPAPPPPSRTRPLPTRARGPCGLPISWPRRCCRHRPVATACGPTSVASMARGTRTRSPS